MFTLKTAKVIGTPNGIAWSQVHGFEVEGEKLEKRGRLLIVLSLGAAGAGVEAVATGREVLARINEEYYGVLEGNPFEGLKKTLEKLAKENKRLELITAIFYQNVGYFGILGGGKVVVKRGSVVQTVLELKSNGKPGSTRLQSLGSEATGGQAETLNNTEKLRISIGSGFIEEGDIFLLGSSKFFEMVAEGTWRAAFGAGEPEEMAEILAPIVAGREKVGGVAGLIVKMEKEHFPTSMPSGVGLIKEEKSEVLPPKAWRLLQQLSSVPSAISRFIPSRAVFVKHKVDQPNRRKTLLTVAIILIFLLLVSVVLGIRKRSTEQKIAKFEKIVVQVEDKLEEGRGLSAIKPAEAKKLFEQAQELLEEGNKFAIRNSQFAILREEINVELAKVVREFKLTEAPLFLDLSLVKEGAGGNDLGLFGKNLVVLDKEGKRLMGIDLEKKSSKILAGGEDLEGATQVTIWDDKAYVLTEKGIIEVSSQIPNSKFQIPKDESWGEIVDLGVYAGNLYLLDKEENAVWRYLVTETGFGTRRNWFKGVSPDLSQVVSFAIDGSVWILTGRGSVPLPAGKAGIQKFTSGSQESFSVIGLEKPLVSSTRIYTDSVSRHIYVLDKDNYRVVVLDKEGNYQASYLWTGIGDVEDMVVSEENKIILLLAKNKIYQIEIR